MDAQPDHRRPDHFKSTPVTLETVHLPRTKIPITVRSDTRPWIHFDVVNPSDNEIADAADRIRMHFLGTNEWELGCLALSFQNPAGHRIFKVALADYPRFLKYLHPDAVAPFEDQVSRIPALSLNAYYQDPMHHALQQLLWAMDTMAASALPSGDVRWINLLRKFQIGIIDGLNNLRDQGKLEVAAPVAEIEGQILNLCRENAQLGPAAAVLIGDLQNVAAARAELDGGADIHEEGGPLHQAQQAVLDQMASHALVPTFDRSELDTATAYARFQSHLYPQGKEVVWRRPDAFIVARSRDRHVVFFDCDLYEALDQFSLDDRVTGKVVTRIQFVLDTIKRLDDPLPVVFPLDAGRYHKVLVKAVNQTEDRITKMSLADLLRSYLNADSLAGLPALRDFLMVDRSIRDPNVDAALAIFEALRTLSVASGRSIFVTVDGSSPDPIPERHITFSPPRNIGNQLAARFLVRHGVQHPRIEGFFSVVGALCDLVPQIAQTAGWGRNSAVAITRKQINAALRTAPILLIPDGYRAVDCYGPDQPQAKQDLWSNHFWRKFQGSDFFCSRKFDGAVILRDPDRNEGGGRRRRERPRVGPFAGSPR